MTCAEYLRVEYGHCGIYCENWVCTQPGKGLDDLCVGCPCNEEEDDCFLEEDYEED